jgi:hypothetical protein
VLIVAADRRCRDRLLREWEDANVIVAMTPLDVVHTLEIYGPAISTVVLSDLVGSVSRAELADFLELRYPFTRVSVITEVATGMHGAAAVELSAPDRAGRNWTSSRRR